jgi:hypothetical protein
VIGRLPRSMRWTASTTSPTCRPRPGGSDERLSLAAALDDNTLECAYVTFDEQQKGPSRPAYWPTW